MKVLITGGYGFIGSHVAERFHQEGFEVIIIDNLTSGKKENVNFKHKGYILSVEDTTCREIFKSHKIDVVVHLAAQVSVADSLSDPVSDAQTNVVGLVNMLNLAAAYQVKKFIYASSAAVYGEQSTLPVTEQAECSPISPYGISKLSGELYCKKWEELYELDILGFRFSNVYGPRQDSSGEGGVISHFLNRLLAEQCLSVFGDGEQTRDFIYVEDVAFAIYRGANSAQTGIYNVSSNEQISINKLIEVIDGLQPVAGMDFQERRKGDIDHSVLDNERLMRDLDWSPLYSIEEGLSKTLYHFEKEYAEKNTVPEKEHIREQRKTWGLVKKAVPTLENLAAFGLVAWLTMIYPVGNGMIDIKLFYITIIGMMHGSRQAMVAVVLSGGLFLYQKLDAGRDFISLTYDTDFFFQLAIYLFVGLVVGYTIERKNTTIKQQEYKVNELSDRYDFLDGVYTDVREVKDELQQRIMNSGDSYGKIYAATKELESLEPEDVFHSAVNVVKTIMQVPKVKMYVVNSEGTYLRLMASSGYEAIGMSKSMKVSDHKYIQSLIDTGEIYVNDRLENNVPLLAAPLVNENRVTAILEIDGLPFESFSMYHQNLFRITADLISSALTKAFTHIKATESQRYIEDSMILRPEVIRDILASKKKAFEQHNVPYLVLNTEGYDLSDTDTADYLASKLRETDYVGLDEKGNLLVLLSNTGREEEEIIINRLTRNSMIWAAATEE